MLYPFIVFGDQQIFFLRVIALKNMIIDNFSLCGEEVGGVVYVSIEFVDMGCYVGQVLEVIFWSGWVLKWSKNRCMGSIFDHNLQVFVVCRNGGVKALKI